MKPRFAVKISLDSESFQSLWLVYNTDCVVLQVNGVFKVIPFSLNNGTVNVYRTGGFLVVSTDLGLEVSYDTNHYVKIQVPSDYQGAISGLCGNFNNDADDDFRTPEGDVVNAADFGNSWKEAQADEAECEDHVCEDCHCPQDQRAVFLGPELCGILKNTTGPFATCHPKLSPNNFVEDCVFDMCLDGRHQHVLCESLNLYSSQCQEQGITLPNWRGPELCGMSTFLCLLWQLIKIKALISFFVVEMPCPAHSHFESQGTGCPATCVNRDGPLHCSLPSRESCICDDGYVLSGAVCVRPQECGCEFEGFYYPSGQTVILDQNCGRVCSCSSSKMTCWSHGCEPGQVCKVYNGERGCHNVTCRFAGELLLFHFRFISFADSGIAYLGFCNKSKSL